MPESITIYDVARGAGVSISTVSNALNRPARVSESTRQRVLEVADELGYTPKLEAASLARKSLRRIGVFAPFTSYDSFLQRLAGVIAEAAASGTEVSVFDHGSAARLAEPVLAGIPLQARFDGLIVMGIALDATVEQRLVDRGIPAVLVDAPSKVFSTVNADDTDGGRLAAEYLCGLGHRRFAYLIERQESGYESQAVSRKRGFAAVLEEYEDGMLSVVEADPTQESAYEVARRILDSDDRPTAIVAHFDEMAAGVFWAARDLGLSVPGDLSVMGFDDSVTAAATRLTTVRQPLRESGREAARTLAALIGSPNRPRRDIRLDLSLTVRATTGPPTS